MKSASSHTSHRKGVFRRKALAVAVSSVLIGFAGAAWGQATTGTIYGTVPAAPGETIQITGGAGFNRTITVDSSGKFSITLPVGTYTVSLLRDGKVVDSRDGVSPVAAGAVEVAFAQGGSAELSEIKVTGTVAPLDVTTTNQVTTITAKQLQQLPLQRTAEDIALLAPGVNMGSPELTKGPLGTPINVFGGDTSVPSGMRGAYRALEDGQALIVFPSGEVSRMRPNGVRDGRWSAGFLRMARKTGAPVLPVHISAHNSPLFYGVSMLAKPLSALLLAREMFGARHMRIGFRIGGHADVGIDSEHLAHRDLGVRQLHNIEIHLGHHNSSAAVGNGRRNHRRLSYRGFSPDTTILRQRNQQKPACFSS